MTTINFKIEENLKQQFEKICDVLGLSISSAINLYIKKVLSVKRIPFTIGLDDNSIETIEFVKAMENIPQGLEKIAKKAGINNEKELLDYFYEWRKGNK